MQAASTNGGTETTYTGTASSPAHLRASTPITRTRASVSNSSASGQPSSALEPLPSVTPLPASVDPFAAIEQAASVGQTLDLKFIRTKLVSKARADAKVSLNGQILLVRMNAKDLPDPTYFNVPRYALWVYVPNYQVKLYIGDLPITLKGRKTSTTANAKEKNRDVPIGDSDSAYRYTALPPGAEFGGLMLTAEPVRYTPIVNEALRPVLVYLAPRTDVNLATSAPAYYAGPLPDSVLERKDPTSGVATPKNRK